MKTTTQFIDLPAVKGIQAGKPFYTVMCPLPMVAKLFTYTDSSLPPAMRAQRVLNKQRIPEMKEYILKNRDSYVFSALTATVDGQMEFIAGRQQSIGRLKINMNSLIIINDGQHRRAAIEAALKECPELRYEDISIVIYDDLGLTRSQQMFTDLNRYAVRPTKSLNILYDNKDSFSLLIKECIDQIPMFCGSVEMEKTSLSNRSPELFTLSGIYHATKELLRGMPLEDEVSKPLVIAYWNVVSGNMPHWAKAKQKEIGPDQFRSSYICAQTITLKALGRLGNPLLREEIPLKEWSKRLTFLQEIDWDKECDDWQGLVIKNGRISSSRNNELAFAEYLLDRSGWMDPAGKEMI